MVNRVAAFLGKGYQLCMRSFFFVAVSLYLSVFPFAVANDLDLSVSFPEYDAMMHRLSWEPLRELNFYVFLLLE